MRRVGFGFLGTTLDAYGGSGAKRHRTWRPSVSFALDESLGLSRFELWHDQDFERLAQTIKHDIEAQNDTVEVVPRAISVRDPWSFEEMYALLFDIAVAYPFDPEREEYFVHLTTGTHVAQICLFLLTETRYFPAKLVQTAPRRGESPGGVTVIDLDLSRYDKLARRYEQKLQSDIAILKAGIPTRNAAFNRLISELELVARSSSEPLLLLGPTGAGKSHLARQVYHLKQSQHRLTGRFVDVNCATIRGDQAMSTLFGHVKGAFTGAATHREGLLRTANGGLLFLDEIGELGLDEQAMLLRALEEKRFFPLGSDREETSDFQLIAGTNRNLVQRVRAGLFREDLFHRINTWSFVLPPLRERPEDIAPNLEYEIRRFEERAGRRVTVSAEARAAYLAFAEGPSGLWPGNFRDLNASVIRMATLAPEGRISVEIVTHEIERLRALWGSPWRASHDDESVDAAIRSAGVTPEGLDLFDRVQLAAVIEAVRRSPTLADAGRVLFAVTRRQRSVLNDSDRVRKYLQRFGLNPRSLGGGTTQEHS